jgi:hypothetical protein
MIVGQQTQSQADQGVLAYPGPLQFVLSLLSCETRIHTHFETDPRY